MEELVDVLLGKCPPLLAVPQRRDDDEAEVLPESLQEACSIADIQHTTYYFLCTRRKCPIKRKGSNVHTYFNNI